MARNAYACETFMGEVRGMVDTLVARSPAARWSRHHLEETSKDSGAATCRVPRLPEVPGGGGAGGFLSERVAKGTFSSAPQAKTASFLTDKPKNARQRKASAGDQVPHLPGGYAATPASRKASSPCSPAAPTRIARGYAGSTARAPWRRCREYLR